jgi:hypothetical protein
LTSSIKKLKLSRIKIWKNNDTTDMCGATHVCDDCC